MNHSLASHASLSLSLVLALAAVARAEEANPSGRPFKGHESSVLCVKFTHDGKTLFSSSRDDTIKVWDVATGRLKQTLTNHSGDVYSVAFSHDGRTMASGAADKKIILWDAATLKPIRTLDGHTAAIRELAFSPDDKTLASAGEDNTFRLWDVETGKLKVTRTEHTQKVKSVEYYPDGKTIATVSADMTVRLWDTSGEPKQVLKGHKDVVEDGAVSPDGKQIVSSSGTNYGQLIFWDARSGKMLYDLPSAHGNDFGKEDRLRRLLARRQVGRQRLEGPDNQVLGPENLPTSAHDRRQPRPHRIDVLLARRQDSGHGFRWDGFHDHAVGPGYVQGLIAGNRPAASYADTAPRQRCALLNEIVFAVHPRRTFPRFLVVYCN